MALVLCRECGKQISSKGKACPNCGAKNQGFPKIVIFLFILCGLGVINSVTENKTTSSKITVADAEAALGEHTLSLLSIVDFKSYARGFGNVLEIDLKIKNDSSFNVQDIQIKCTSYVPSGTALGETVHTIYDVFPAHKTKKVATINMGLVDPQSNGANCRLTDFSFQPNGKYVPKKQKEN